MRNASLEILVLAAVVFSHAAAARGYHRRPIRWTIPNAQVAIQSAETCEILGRKTQIGYDYLEF